MRRRAGSAVPLPADEHHRDARRVPGQLRRLHGLCLHPEAKGGLKGGFDGVSGGFFVGFHGDLVLFHVISIEL